MTQIGCDGDRHEVVPPDGSRLVLSWAGATDVGKRRPANEDSFVTKPPVFAVADGMGGHSAGDVASAAVARRLADQAVTPFVARPAIDAALSLAVADIERDAGPSELGTGTTVTGVALTLLGPEAYWLVFNIGDSRVYRYTRADERLVRLTVDHSVVQELLDAGMISPEEAEGHPQGNIITRAVGFNEAPAPDYRLVPVEAGTRLVLCSDGLTKEVRERQICGILERCATPGDATRELVALALRNGGRDNVTAVVLDVTAG